MFDCCQLLIAQHNDTRKLLDTLEAKLQDYEQGKTGLATVEAVYAALTLDLKQHFMLEEQGLFEVLNQYRSMILMEVEHDDLLSLQHELGAAIKACDDLAGPTTQVMQRFQAYKTRLLAHMVEEETGIFPRVSQQLEPEEHQKVLRLYQELQQKMQAASPVLNRPNPSFTVHETALFQPVARPVQYQTLYEREHNSIQHLSLQAGQTLAKHWAGQHQCMVLLSGRLTFDSEGKTTLLIPGMMVRMDSRLWFSLVALEDSHVILAKLWPHPHFVKS